MRILCFVDVHGDFGAIRKLAKKARKADLLICAGDISRFETDIDLILQKLDEIGRKILIIHGNHEGSDYLAEKCEKFDNLVFFHKKTEFIEDVLFIGHGGGGFEEKSPNMEKFFQKNEDMLRKAQKSVFITHAPPFKTKLDVIGRNHNGNNTLRNLIIKYQPVYAISGHFHENWGKKDTIGMCKVLNPGPYGVLIDI